MRDDFGDRMKMYEGMEAGRRFMPGLPIIARIDGRSFHNFTKGMNRPFDETFTNCMIETTVALVKETGANLGFAQSDEISLCWYVDNPKQQVWFDGRIQKMTSQLAAQAAQVILNQNKTEIAAQQSQQAAQDPIVQMQQQELAIKKQDAETKQKKVITDAAAKADQIELERARIASQEKIAGMQIGAKVRTDKANLEARQQTDGLRIGVDVAKSKDQIQAQHRQASLTHEQALAQLEAQSRNQTPKGNE